MVRRLRFNGQASVELARLAKIAVLLKVESRKMFVGASSHALRWQGPITGAVWNWTWMQQLFSLAGQAREKSKRHPKYQPRA